jgi:hypothetical protein
MTLDELQERIRLRLSHGGSLEQVEAEIIDPSPYSPDQKAALWLFAFSTARKSRRESRSLASRALRLVGG